jgi:hypothetical protein
VECGRNLTSVSVGRILPDDWPRSDEDELKS